MITEGLIALLLCHLDKEILFSKNDLVTVNGELDAAVSLKLGISRVAVDGSKSILDAAKVLTVLRTYGTKLGLEVVSSELRNVVGEYNLLNVKLLGDNRNEACVGGLIRLNVHLCHRLTVLDRSCVTACTAENHNVDNLVHVLLKILIDKALVCNRIVAEVDRNGCRLINRANKVAIDILGHEGDHGSSNLCDSNKSGVKSHICVNLIGGHILYPESLTATANVPVGKLVNKALKRTGSLGQLVVSKAAVNRLYGRVKLGKKPLIHYGKSGSVKCVLCGIKAVDVSIENVERIGVPECTHKLSLTLDNRITEEAVRKPGCRVGVEVPTDRVSAIGLKRLEGIDSVALGLRHLLTVLIKHVTENENVLIRSFVKDKGRNCHQRVEPTTGLVNTLGDEICRELALKHFLILKGIVPLCEGHRAGVEPTVDNLAYTLHLTATLITLDSNGVDEGTVKLNVVGTVVAHRLKLLDRADRMLVTALTLPDVKRSTPISVTGETPVLNVGKPITETTLTDILGNPVYGVIILNKVVTHLGHLDEPSVASIVNKRSVTSPAMRIIVLELGCGEELALLLKILNDHRISFLNKETCIGCFPRHLALAVNELNEGKTVSSTNLVIVLTECGGDMNDTCTVGHSNVVVCGDVMSLLALLFSTLSGAIPKSLVASTLKVKALHFFKDLVCGSTLLALNAAEDRVKKCLCHIVNVAVSRLYLTVGVGGVNAKRNVRGECPGCGCPCKEVSILVYTLKAYNGRSLFNRLIALCNLVRGKRSTASGAVRNDLKALVEQTLVPDLLKRPPLRLNKVVGVSNVGVFHISPETNCAGEVLPHSLVCPYRLLAMSDEGLKSVCLDLILAVDAKLLFNLKLNGETVSIPACLTKNASTLHGVVSGNHILDYSGKNVADMRLTVCGRGSIKEGVVFSTLTKLDRLLENALILPELSCLFFSFNEIQVR